MKFFVPLVCCLALVKAIPGGQSVSSRSQDDWGNYEFGYDIVDEYGAQNGRQEKGDAHGNKVGSYTIKDHDGRSRRVDYVADAHGFRATIGTNEPGTATSHVGDATYLSSAPIITAEPAKLLAAAPAHYAPTLLAAPAPLALAHSAPLLRAAPLGLGLGLGLSHSAQLLSAPQLIRSHSSPLLTRSYAAPTLLAADPWTKAW